MFSITTNKDGYVINTDDEKQKGNLKLISYIISNGVLYKNKSEMINGKKWYYITYTDEKGLENFARLAIDIAQPCSFEIEFGHLDILKQKWLGTGPSKISPIMFIYQNEHNSRQPTEETKPCKKRKIAKTSFFTPVANQTKEDPFPTKIPAIINYNKSDYYINKTLKCSEVTVFECQTNDIILQNASEDGKALWKALENSSLTIFKILGAKALKSSLFHLNGTPYLEAIFNVMKIPRKIFIEENKLGKLDGPSWNKFCESLGSSSNLLYLDLNKNNLNQLNEEQWEAFGNFLEKSKIKTLKLPNNELAKMDEKKWSAFCDALLKSNLKYLDLENNNLNTLSEKQWKNLGIVLEKLELEHCNLPLNYLGQITCEFKWKACCDTLSKILTKELILGDNVLSRLSSEKLEILKTSFSLKKKKYEIKLLSLDSNELEEMETADWKKLCEIIHIIQPKTLNIKYNYLDSFKDENFNIFCDTLKKNERLKKLVIKSTDLHKLPKNKLEKLFDILKGKITNINLSENAFDMEQTDKTWLTPLCNFLENSILKSFTFKFTSDQVDEENPNLFYLPETDWCMLSNAISRCKSIKSFRFCSERVDVEDDLIKKTSGYLFDMCQKSTHLAELVLDIFPLNKIDWEKFKNSFKSNNINTLHLNDCKLHKVSDKMFCEFKDVLQLSKIEKLIINETKLFCLDEKRFEIFLDSFITEKLTSLSITARSLIPLDKKKWELFTNILKTSNIICLNIIGDELSKSQLKQLEEIIYPEIRFLRKRPVESLKNQCLFVISNRSENRDEMIKSLKDLSEPLAESLKNIKPYEFSITPEKPN